MVTDADIVKHPETKKLRHQLAPMVPMLKIQLQFHRSDVPSYVAEAFDALIAGYERWTKEEKAS